MSELSSSNEVLCDRIKKLEERNRFLENILDTLPLNVFVKDTDRNYCYTNKTCDEVNGVERGGLLGKSDFDRNTPTEIAQQYRNDDLKIMQTRQESRLVSPGYDGDKLGYYNIIKRPLIDDSDDVTGILGIVIEVPGNKTNASEQLLNHCDGLVFDYDIATGKSIILKSLKNFDPFSSDSFILEDILKKGTLFTDDIPVLENVFEKVRAGEEKNSVLLRFYDNDHTLCWCKLFLNCIYDNDMQPVRALGILQPVSSMTMESEKRKLEIANVNGQLMNILGNHYDTFLYLNEEQNYYQILYARGLWATLPKKGTLEDYCSLCHTYLNSSDYDATRIVPKQLDKAEDSHTGKGFFAMEIRFLEEDGNYRWKEVEFFPIKDAQSYGTLIAIFDVDDVVKNRHKQRLKEINNDVIDILSTVVEFRSVESGDHIQRIKGFTKIMLNYINKIYDDVNYSSELIDIISSASAMHDIGKIAIPDSILLKPGKLTAEEFEEMKTHTTRGCDILKSMPQLPDERYYKYSYDICRYHHERFDGHGYPDGLTGNDIPLEAQVVSVADVYDALISKRVYKDAYSLEEAYDMILNGECGIFDPKLMKCFTAAREELENCARSYFMASNA